MFELIKGGSYEDIQGLRCWIPPQPAKHLIAGYDLPKKDQMWKRTELPEEWEEWREEEAFQQEEDPEYAHPQIYEFVKQEWDRRLNGYWLFINGKATYLTGKHYFYVNWWKLDSGYPDYRDTDRQLFYFWQYCIEDENCYGICELTARRQGKSYRAGSICYETISKPPGKRSGGIQSKTGDDAEELFKEKIIEPWKDLPDFFKPESNSGSDPKTILSFFRDTTRGKKAKKIKYTAETELRSFIDWKNAKEIAYDGKKKFILIHDEAAKLDPAKEGDAYRRWEVCKPILKENGRVAGKMYMCTTVEEMEKGGEVFKRIYNDSDHTAPRSEVGETRSGLYRYFLPAYQAEYYDQYGYAAEGDPTKDQKEFLIKKYGKRAENGARAYFDAVRRSLGSDQKALYSFQRKYPYTADEAFYTDADQCEFNAFILTKNQRELEYNKNTCVRGDFVPISGRDSAVKFVPNEANGRFKVSYIPPEQDQNRVGDRGFWENKNHFFPENIIKFVIGCDPIDHGAQTVDGKKSNAAAYVFRKFDMLVDGMDKVFTAKDIEANPLDDWKLGKLKWKTNVPIVQYVYRPDESSSFYEDMINLCRFYGCKILAENQKVGIINHFKERGYESFIMHRPGFTFTDDRRNQSTPGIPSSTPMIQQYTEKIMAWVQNYGHLCPFKELTDDLIKFRPAKPREHDPTVAFGFTLIAAESKEEPPPVAIDPNDIFPSYPMRIDL